MKKRILLKDNQNNELYPRPCLPVGCMIFLNNALDPNTYFMGTWEKVEEEVFFMTSSSNFPVGQVSGSNTHALTVDELPEHYHSLTGHKGADVWAEGDLWYRAAGEGSTNTIVNTQTGSTGSSKPFDVRPRKYAVNAWVRTS